MLNSRTQEVFIQDKKKTILGPKLANGTYSGFSWCEKNLSVKPHLLWKFIHFSIKKIKILSVERVRFQIGFYSFSDFCRYGQQTYNQNPSIQLQLFIVRFSCVLLIQFFTFNLHTTHTLNSI